LGLPTGLWAAPEATQFQGKLRNVELCNGVDRSSTEPQIKGCTALIESGKETTLVLSIAHTNRGNAYAAKGDFDRAISDYDLAIKYNPSFSKPFNNRGVAVRPVSDWAQYGLADFWASPLQTLANGAGDCEDYAILKYVALRELGILPDDLRLVIVQDDKHEVGHAVVAVRYEQRWLILDNRTMAILDAEDVSHYRPLFALDQQGTRTVATAALDRITDR
jgi:tetratricopeptide (TPR) repeat protein